jgi:WD40 repeat protein
MNAPSSVLGVHSLCSLSGHGNDNHPYTLIFSPDGRTLAAGGVGQTVWEWDITGIPRP